MKRAAGLSAKSTSSKSSSGAPQVSAYDGYRVRDAEDVLLKVVLHLPADPMYGRCDSNVIAVITLEAVSQTFGAVAVIQVEALHTLESWCQPWIMRSSKPWMAHMAAAARAENRRADRIGWREAPG